MLLKDFIIKKNELQAQRDMLNTNFISFFSLFQPVLRFLWWTYGPFWLFSDLSDTYGCFCCEGRL